MHNTYTTAIWKNIKNTQQRRNTQNLSLRIRQADNNFQTRGIYQHKFRNCWLLRYKPKSENPNTELARQNLSTYEQHASNLDRKSTNSEDNKRKSLLVGNSPHRNKLDANLSRTIPFIIYNQFDLEQSSNKLKKNLLGT